MHLLQCCIIITISSSFIEGATIKELQRIFQTPKRRNYDNLEILERSNFGEEPEMQYELIKNPKSVANAQVMLRFGGEERSCGCRDVCQCGGPYHGGYPPYPYPPSALPYPYYPPYYYPPPPTPCYRPADPTTILQTQNVDNGGVQIVDQAVDLPRQDARRVVYIDPIVEPSVVGDATRATIVQNQNIDNGGFQVIDQDLAVEPVDVLQNQNIDNGGLQVIDQDLAFVGGKTVEPVVQIFQNQNVDNGGIQLVNQDVDPSDDDDADVILVGLEPEQKTPIKSSWTVVQNQNIDNGGVQIVDQKFDLSDSDLAIIDPSHDDVVLQVTPEKQPESNIFQNQNIDNGGVQIVNQDIDLLNDAPIVEPVTLNDPSETEVYLDPSELTQNVLQNQNINNDGIQIIEQELDGGDDEDVVRPDPIGRVPPCSQGIKGILVPYPVYTPIYSPQQQVFGSSDILRLLSGWSGVQQAVLPAVPAQNNDYICFRADNCPCSQCRKL